MVQHNQFGGSALEDPNIHLRMFLEMVDTIKMNGVAKEYIRLHLFPFSLRDKARGWMQSLSMGSIITWEDMATRFLEKFFPPAKSAQLRTEISIFRQMETENLYEAWECFKDLLRKHPQHNYEDWVHINYFIMG